MSGSLAKFPVALRRGDGRARLISIETLNACRAKPVSVWQSGETARIRVAVRFEKDVADPVVGIMIRTRIGMEVYGTNTELEKLKTRALRSRRAPRRDLRIRMQLCALSSIRSQRHRMIRMVSGTTGWKTRSDSQSPIRDIPLAWLICARALLALENEGRGEARDSGEAGRANGRNPRGAPVHFTQERMRMNIDFHLAHLDRAIAMQRELGGQTLA